MVIINFNKFSSQRGGPYSFISAGLSSNSFRRISTHIVLLSPHMADDTLPPCNSKNLGQCLWGPPYRDPLRTLLPSCDLVPLLFVHVENGATVFRPAVATLLVERDRIMPFLPHVATLLATRLGRLITGASIQQPSLPYMLRCNAIRPSLSMPHRSFAPVASPEAQQAHPFWTGLTHLHNHRHVGPK